MGTLLLPEMLEEVLSSCWVSDVLLCVPVLEVVWPEVPRTDSCVADSESVPVFSVISEVLLSSPAAAPQKLHVAAVPDTRTKSKIDNKK